MKKLDPDCHIKFLIFSNDEECTIKTRHNYQSTPLVPIASEKLLKLKVSDPQDIIYLHKACFSAKTKTLPTAIEIVIYSLENYKNIINCQIQEATKTIENAATPETPSVNRFYSRALLGSVSILCLAGIGYYFLNKDE